MDRILLRGGTPGDGHTEIEFDESSVKWPVRIWGADRYYISMTDEEARHLMEILIDRYPLDGLAEA